MLASQPISVDSTDSRSVKNGSQNITSTEANGDREASESHKNGISENFPSTISPPSERKSMMELSSTLSASSSLSGSNTSDGLVPNAEPGLTSRFKHYQRPTVSDSPYLVSLCQRYIAENNVEGLAKVARNRGLPPLLRQYAWPLLLATHPYVISPSLVDEFPDDPTCRTTNNEEIEIPYRRIKGEISRYRKKLHSKSTNTGSNSRSISTYATSSGQDTPTDQKVSSSASTPTNESSKLIDGGLVAEAIAFRLEDQRFEIIEDAVVKFLERWRLKIPYDPGMIWCATALADWVHPIYEMHDSIRGPSQKRNSSGSSSNSDHSGSSSPELSPLQAWDVFKFSFASIFEQLMLVILHSPARGSDGPSGPLDSPINGRGMLFMSAIRNNLPELSAHFDEEHILCSIGGDDWLLWWIKWLGVKAWNKHDLARLWDMYLGWRPNESVVDGEEEANTINKSGDERQQGLGLDPFWNPNDLDTRAHILDPHTQHVFVCVSILKAVKSTIMELDQSEIRQFLMRLPKAKDIEFIVTEAGEDWRSWQWKEEEEEEE